jgi:D-3-phosphoglycerate dehydrogenase
MKAGVWQRREGIELAGRCLGLLGCGRIGQLVADMAIGLGMHVVAYDPCPPPAAVRRVRFREGAGLEDVLRAADVLSLHCPPPADNRALLTGERLAMLKPGAFLINTARGELLDDTAVLEALVSGHLSGAALDAYRQEPPEDSPLLQHEHVIAVPHIGAFTRESVARAVEVAVNNLLIALQDGPTAHRSSGP